MTDEEFSEAIIAMTDALYRVCYSQLPQGCDREDAIQESLSKAWKKRHSLRDERYLQTWIVRILLNVCHDIRKKRELEHPADELPERNAPDDADFELHQALFALDKTLRLPVVLHYVEGFSIREVARILRCPQGTVKSRMSRGRQELRKMLSGKAEG